MGFKKHLLLILFISISSTVNAQTVIHTNSDAQHPLRHKGKDIVWDGSADLNVNSLTANEITLDGATISETYVPYVGATGSVNLGNNAIFSGTGTFGQITCSGISSTKVIFSDANKQLTSIGIGTASQFIKGDGSLDSNTYLTTEADTLSAVLGRGNTTGGTDVAFNTNGDLITDGTNTSIDPYNRKLYASDGVAVMLDWSVDGTGNFQDNNIVTTGAGTFAIVNSPKITSPTNTVYFGDSLSSAIVAGRGTFTLVDVIGSSAQASIDHVPSGIGGIDSYAKTVLHLDTNFTDSAISPKTWLAGGGAAITATSPKFGAGSVNIPSASSSYIYTADSTDWAFGTSNFVVDFWVNFTTLPSSGSAIYLWSQFPNTGVPRQTMEIYNNAGSYEIYYQYNNGSATTINVAPAGTSLSTGSWIHLALVRSGSSWFIFKNGSQVGTTTTDADAVGDSTGQLRVGTREYSPTNFLNGKIDEFRVSVGTDRGWTTTFTPPTAEYSIADTYPYLYFKGRGSQKAKLWTDGTNGDAFKIDVPSTTRMTIESDGDIGIGTSAPTEKLEVNGDLKLTSDNQVISLGDVGDASISYNGSNLFIDPNVVGTGSVVIHGSATADFFYTQGAFVGGTGTFSILSGTGTVGFVPYTGATSDVDLGEFDLTTTGTGTFGGIINSCGEIGNITIVTNTYTILPSDSTIICNKESEVTVTLPVISVGQKFTVKNINSGTVTLRCQPSNFIEGASSQQIYQGESLQLQAYDSTNWIVL